MTEHCTSLSSQETHLYSDSTEDLKNEFILIIELIARTHMHTRTHTQDCSVEFHGLQEEILEVVLRVTPGRQLRHSLLRHRALDQ